MKRPLLLLLPLLALALPALAQDPATNAPAATPAAKRQPPHNPERKATMNQTTEHTDYTDPATPDLFAPSAAPADDDEDRLPAWRLALPPRKGVILRKTKTPGGSKFGGDPFLPDGVEWPREPSGGEMSFLAQIRCEDLPRDLGFPKTGALFFFLDQADYDWEPEEDTEHLHSRVVYADGPLPAAPRRRTTPDPQPTPEVFVRIEPVLCRPDDCRKYYDLGGRPVHRMLGHPDSFQLEEDTPPPAEDRVLLLQLDSDDDPDGTDWCWGDMGMLYFYLSPDDFKAGRFKNAMLESECY